MSSVSRYISIASICRLTDNAFDVVYERSKRLGLKPPFTVDRADALCIDLTGKSLLDLSRQKDATDLHSSSDNDSAPSSLVHIRLPKIASGDGSCRLYQWLVGDGWNVEEGQPVAKVLRLDLGTIEVVNASSSGRIKFYVAPLDTLKAGQCIASLEPMHAAYAYSESATFHDDSQSGLGGSVFPVNMPFSPFGTSYQIEEWLALDNSWVIKDQPVVKLRNYDSGLGIIMLQAQEHGYLRYIKALRDIVQGGSLVALIDAAKANASIEVSSSANAAPLKKGTFDAVKLGSINTRSSEIPRFHPSLATEPAGFIPFKTFAADLEYSFAQPQSCCQSFFNDLEVVDWRGISDDIMSLASFDEQLYCSLVREMHRYSLAEIADNQSDLAKKNAGLGAMVGSLIGVISGNIFAPFLGHSYGKNFSDRGKKVEEFLPDPNLLFYQDENSYLSWSRGQVASPRLRRLIFDRRVKPDGKVFFRLVPAIVTSDSVFPVQLFKVDSKTYFYRPFSAGINRNQPNYDSVKLQRRYFHLRGEGAVDETGLKITVTGGDVEEYETKIFSFRSPSLSYFYVDFKIHPGSLF
jgi:hypothetical protein